MISKLKSFAEPLLLILAFALVLSGIGYLLTEKDSKIEQLWDENWKLDKESDSLEFEVSKLKWKFNQRLYAVSKYEHGNDWFIFQTTRPNERGDYFFSTNMPVNDAVLQYIYRVCIDSGVPLWFVNDVLWSESRFGVNVMHKQNRDGSIDKGYFGLNSSQHPASTGNPKEDVFLFIEHFRGHTERYPKSKWLRIYKMGETRAKKYGIIK